MQIDAQSLDFETLNRKIKETAGGAVSVSNLLGQRYIGSGLRNKKLTLSGIPGNALGAYLHTCEIVVHGNVQDAVGDTMNDGRIVVHGNAGDALGYAMRGGEIFIRGNVGYRAGIHMKAYGDVVPKIVIGGNAGDFLGEYQAGGVIVVLGGQIGHFPATGMHGGKIYVRGEKAPADLPPQVSVTEHADVSEIAPLIETFGKLFSVDIATFLTDRYFLLTPSQANPYHALYCNRSL